ncbi:hypothetical protein LV780_19910 (plasmid) [Cereibacter azotoformans]|uniref:hypothetical protein n=1 Tax=Cereibacter azotoformans TaxID=43057 RepID=UPI000E35E199|nr:hypothetical protein [Cereibacter azotoformans]AXQ96026.1 hypothetical protein D0Z66_19975 [Cereibacter sphaeroides]UIJ33095.1 hypothetical protein LV780_19910 [Cereibacter azotoformans]
MARVVLHIGTHKTATTTIQDMFAHNADLLRQHGVIYPRLSRVAGHHGLVMEWNKLPEIYALPNGSIETLKQLARNYAKVPGTLFLSSEEFSRGKPGARVDFRAVRELLSDFESVSVVCVVREQWQFMQSIYLQASKERQPPRPSAMVDSVLRSDMTDGLWIDYNLLYDHLLAAFAPEEITFLDFDTCRRHRDGVVGAMLETLECGLSGSSLKVVHDGLSNVSPLALPTFAACVITEPDQPARWVLECTTGAFRLEYGDDAKSCLWTRSEFAQLMEYARQRNGRLSERLKGVQPEFRLSESDPHEGRIHRDGLNLSFWTRSCRWMYRARKS